MAEDPKLELMSVRVPQGTFERIDTLLKGGELRSTFIRTAVQNEIDRRSYLRASPEGEIRKSIQQMETELARRKATRKSTSLEMFKVTARKYEQFLRSLLPHEVVPFKPGEVK